MNVETGIIASESVLPDELIEDSEHLHSDTPYGQPSSPPLLGTFVGRSVAVIRRHGIGHATPPHMVNHRANITALRDLHVDFIMAANSVGSMREEVAPGSVFVPDDYVSLWDVPTFYDEEVVHATPEISPRLLEAADRCRALLDFPVRVGGVYVQTHGPRLETKAEIAVLREYGDVVGMTMASEATLSTEAGLDYLSLCSVDNYCHGVSEGALDWEGVLAAQKDNSKRVRQFLRVLLEATE